MPWARRQSKSVSVGMEVESAPEAENMDVCDDCNSSSATHSAVMSSGDSGFVCAEPDVSSHNKENDGVQRGGQAHRSSPLDAAVITKIDRR